uniref:Cystatin domain-containing protein n=1 Tax=Electrophorus electricus TaxID=8005 RepID=A0AAY5EBE3_ELEEL
LFSYICFQVKPCVEEKTRESFTIFEPLTFRSQVVKGMNYDIVVCVYILV